MKCQVESCTVERQDLSQHIRLDHQMTIKQYKEKYNVQYVIDEEKRKKRGATRRDTNQRTKQFKCEICNEAFSTNSALKAHYFDSEDSKHNNIIFNETNFDEWVECVICGCRRSRLDFHLKAKHNMTRKEYFENYQKPCYSKKFMERTSEGARLAVYKGQYAGEKNHFYGKHHSEESRKSIGETTKLNNSKLEVHFNKGSKRTLETRQKMSLSRIGEKNPMFGKQPDIKTAHSIHGYRKDIGHGVRPTLEANYARYLRYNGILYEFEPKSFLIKTDIGEEHCWIDFYLIETDEWIELKNYIGRDIRKIEYVRVQYPQLKINILYANSDQWLKIEEEYSRILPLWETSRQNLRTHPELYL